MQTLEALLAANPGFEFPTQFCAAGAMGRSFVCFQNYYDQIFRGADVPVDLHVFGFDQAGRQVGGVTIKLETAQAVQVPDSELGMKEPGLIAVAALPRFDLVALAGERVRLRRRIGTGFYIIWQGASGQIDTMHEWLPVSAAALPRQVHYVVFDHMGGRIARYGLVLLSPVLDRASTSEARLAIYGRSGRKLGAAELPALAAMGSRLVYLDELFAKFLSWLAAEGALGVRIESRNMVEPLSVEIHRSGDFHLHHIN